jgi:GxxExxY protein
MVYRDQVVGEFRLDLIVEGELVVEIKSVQHLEDVFVSQVLTYLKATDRRLGLILNFNCSTLRSGIRRVIR